MKANCLPMLDAWKKAADPVDGVREALRYFGLVWRQQVVAVTPPREQSKLTDVPENKSPVMYNTGLR
jgi:hypothetical protein